MKRPGRIDLKIPILPTTKRVERAGLIAALAGRYDLVISLDEMRALEPHLPLMLTPGAAEALVDIKAYPVARTEDVRAGAALLVPSRLLGIRCRRTYSKSDAAPVREATESHSSRSHYDAWPPRTRSRASESQPG